MRFRLFFYAFLISAGTLFVLGEKSTKKGTLIDRLCGQTMAANAEKVGKHGRECALMESCMRSGFGLVVNGKFLNFDKEGNRLALVIFRETERQNNVQVKVTGNFSGNKVEVTKIVELPH